MKASDEHGFDRCHQRTIGELRFCICRDRRADDTGNHQWVTEAWVKQAGGLKHQVMRWHKRPRITEIHIECTGKGFFSKRPYRLAQACDGSITAPVVALYADWCHARSLNAASLMRKAYGADEDWSADDFARARAQAEWEGTAFPQRWDKRAVRGLLESLHEINYHQLAERVEAHSGSGGSASHAAAVGTSLHCPGTANDETLPKRA